MNGRVDPIVDEERRLRLYEIRVLGVSVWRLIRVPVLDFIVAKRRSLGRSNQNRFDWHRTPIICASILRSVWHLPRLRRRKYLILGFPRRRFDDGEWIDPFSDPLIEYLGEENVLCLERPFGGEHCRPQRTRHIVHADWLSALTLVVSWVLAFLPMLAFPRQIGRLAAGVRRIGPVPSWRIRVIAGKSIVGFWFERLAAAAFLAIIKPEAVLLTMRRHHYPMIHAAKARGIAVFELQHGAMAEGGFKYSTPFDATLDPDVFLTFGEFWNGFEWGMPAAAVQAIGFKYIADMPQVMPVLRETPRRTIMLVSQPHVWRTLEKSFAAMIASFPEMRFILKLHPQDVSRWWERYPSGKASNVQVCEGMYPDLYELFRECDCVCGYDSTVLFEAAFLGIKVGILNPDGVNPCPALAFDGRFNFHEIQRPEQLQELVRMETHAGKEGGNPFFSRFQHERFCRLLRSGT